MPNSVKKQNTAIGPHHNQMSYLNQFETLEAGQPLPPIEPQERGSTKQAKKIEVKSG
jgi:hypothetical protein